LGIEFILIAFSIKSIFFLIIYFSLRKLNSIFHLRGCFEIFEIAKKISVTDLNTKKKYRHLPKSIRHVFRTLERAIISSSRNRLDRARGRPRPNVNILMVIDLRPVFGVKPKASPTLVKCYQIFNCRSLYPCFGIFRGEWIAQSRHNEFSNCSNIRIVLMMLQFFLDFIYSWSLFARTIKIDQFSIYFWCCIMNFHKHLKIYSLDCLMIEFLYMKIDNRTYTYLIYHIFKNWNFSNYWYFQNIKKNIYSILIIRALCWIFISFIYLNTFKHRVRQIN